MFDEFITFSLDVPLAPGPLDTGLVQGVNSHKGESKRFVSVFSGKHTILMALCKEPLFAKLSMPFKNVFMDGTPCTRPGGA
jgi:hypothetical protein